VLDLHTDFLTKLASYGVDDMFLLAKLEGEGLPTQYLSLGNRSLEWGAQYGVITTGGMIPADRATWVATDGSFNTRRDTLDSEPPRCSISFTNLDGAWYEALHQNALDYNGASLTLLTVFATVDPIYITDSLRCRITDGPWMLSGGVLGDNGVSFDFGAAFNALKLRVPALLMRARRCQFAYKGPYCRSTSDLPTCPKDPHGCAQRQGDILRFSAWPYSNKKIF
jgi:hypothetical protein